MLDQGGEGYSLYRFPTDRARRKIYRFGKPNLAGRAGFDQHTPIRVEIVVEIITSD